MKVYESSVLRPFGSLVRGVLTISVVLGVLGVAAVLLLYGGAGRWRPDFLCQALTMPLFLGAAGLTLVIGVWMTLESFGGSRGSYRMAPTELEVWSGLLHKKMVAVRYGKITDITLSQGPLMQLLGTYDLTITADYRCVTLHGIRSAVDLRLQLLERRDSLKDLESDEDGPDNVICCR